MSEPFFGTAASFFLVLRVRILSSFGDLCQQDMGTGLPFRPATFDGCISVSALQVLYLSILIALEFLDALRGPVEWAGGIGSPPERGGGSPY